MSASASCGHGPKAPITNGCPDCIKRAQARSRQFKARGGSTGPDGTVPGLRLTRGHVDDIQIALAETREARKELELQIQVVRRDGKKPSDVLSRLLENVRQAEARLLPLVTYLADETAHIYPTVLSRQTWLHREKRE